MGHRHVPTRHDVTAQRFLSVAAELIDAYLRAGPVRPDQQVRLQQVHFPTALEWLRTEDVIRLAGLGRNEAASRREFFSRWRTREDFLPDAVVYTLLREYDAHDPTEYVERIPTIPSTITSVSTLLIGIAEGLVATLVRHPRSYLVLHLGPLLPQHPRLWNSLFHRGLIARGTWAGVYEQLVNGLDLVMRPEWTIERTSLVLQAMLDGFVLRHRIQPDENLVASSLGDEAVFMVRSASSAHPVSRWEGASIFADAIIAFIIGAVDWDLTGQPGRAALDTLVRP